MQKRGQPTQSLQRPMSLPPEPEHKPEQANQTGSAAHSGTERKKGFFGRRRLWGSSISVAATIAAIILNLTTISNFVANVTRQVHIHLTNRCTVQTSINFDASPAKNPITVGQYVNVYGVNKWPTRKILWLFVFADSTSDKQVYYPASQLKLNGNSWVFNNIKLGGKSDINLLYPIDIVLVNQSANKIIQAQVNADAMNNGMKSLPAGASVVASVVVSRVC